MFAEGKIGVNDHLKQNVIRKNSYVQNEKRNSVSKKPQVSNQAGKYKTNASDIEMQQIT